MPRQYEWVDFWFDRERLQELVPESDRATNFDSWLANVVGYKTPQEANGLLTGRHRPREEHLRRIEEALGVARSEFERKKPTAVFSLESLEDVYRSLGSDHLVSIASADGFKEAQNRGLFDEMIELVRRGIAIRYYFPEDSSASRKDFYDLWNLYLRSLESDELERVSAYQVDSSAARLFGWRTRLVIISRWQEKGREQLVDHVFLYSRAGATVLQQEEVGDDDLREVWIRLEKKRGREYYMDLVTYSLPVSREPRRDRLISRLQNEYRFSFTQETDAQIYRRLRDYLDSGGTVKGALVELADRTWGNILRSTAMTALELRILEIGPGDGHVTSAALEAIGTLFPQLPVVLTAVEPPSRTNPDQHTCLKDCRRINEPFEKFEGSELKFDLILSVHSFYLIDPGYLLRIVELLKPDGAAILVMAPKANNFLSEVTFIIDQELIAEEPGNYKIPPYDEKIIRDDPLRNYAEDVENAIWVHLGIDSGRVESEDRIPYDEVFEVGGQLTPLGEQVVRLFGHGLLGVTENVRDQLRLTAARMRKEESLPCYNQRFIIERPKVMRALQYRANGDIVGS